MNKNLPFKVKIYFSTLLLSCLSIIFWGNHLPAQTLLTTISLGPDAENGIEPRGVGVNHETNRIYTVNVGSANISVIDGETDKLIDTISIGDGDIVPIDIGVNSVTNRIYVFDVRNVSVSVIGGETNKVMATIRVGTHETGPFGFVPGQGAVGVNPVTNRIYIVDLQNASLSVIDGESNKVIDTIRIQESNAGADISINPLTNRIYVNNGIRIIVISGETNTIIDNIVFSDTTTFGNIAVNSTLNRIYAIRFDSASSSVPVVSVINGETNEVVEDISSEINDVSGQNVFTPRGEIKINPVTNLVYVGGFVGGKAAIIVIDGETNKVIDNVKLDEESLAIGVNPATNRIYSGRERVVDVIDGDINEIINNITIGASPEGIGVNPMTNRIYVSESVEDKVVVIDGETNAIIGAVDVEGDPRDVEVNPTTNLVYVISQEVRANDCIVCPVFDDNIFIIDGNINEVINKIDFGDSTIDDIVINPATNRIYVSIGTATERLLIVIDGETNEIIEKIDIARVFESRINLLPGRCLQIEINPLTNRLYLIPHTASFKVIDIPVNFISVIDGDTNRFIDRIFAGIGPFQGSLGINPATGRIYLTFTSGSSVGKIPSIGNYIPVIDIGGRKGHITDVISPGFDIRDILRFDIQDFRPALIGVNPSTNHIYVSNLTIDLLLIDGGANKIVGAVSSGVDRAGGIVGVGASASGIAVNPQTNRIYVISQGSGNMGVIQDAK